MTRWLNSLIISLVPLHSLSNWFRFLNEAIGSPTFNSRQWFRTPLNLNVCRDSSVYKRLCSSSWMFVILSTLKNSYVLPGRIPRMISFMLSTSSFLSVRIARSWRSLCSTLLFLKFVVYNSYKFLYFFILSGHLWQLWISWHFYATAFLHHC